MPHQIALESIQPSGTPAEHLNDELIRWAWQEVILNHHDNVEGVRPVILRSWIRCREKAVPYREPSRHILQPEKIRALLESKSVLGQAAEPVLNMLEVSVRGTGFIVTLADKNGYVLMVKASEDMQKMAARSLYRTGCCRSEEATGTNAIGLCLIEKVPIQVTGAEHYNEYHHLWTCSSAPIHDVNNNLLGSITLSGRYIGKHQHTLALVVSAAKIIEGHLREKYLTQEKLKLNSMLTSTLNSITAGVISVTGKMMVTNMNSVAARLLGVATQNVIGKQLDEVVDIDSILIDAITNQRYFANREVVFGCRGGLKTYICSVSPIFSQNSQAKDSIITIAEKEKVIRIVKKIGGNSAKYEFGDIKGQSERLLQQIEMAKIAAGTTSRILLSGESGTGKELFAQAIHNYSNRHDAPFVAVSCAAIPRDLIEAELFGYCEGAFTGARREGQVGKFELAHRGTLFLDEINSMPLDVQTKLLRTLQEGEILRLGDKHPIKVDVRIIAATNVNLLEEVEANNFREDLYYRLNVVEIDIPPLRERPNDVNALIQHILSQLCLKSGLKIPEISAETLKIMHKYPWPGNVRELENVIERALLLSRGKEITQDLLPKRITTCPAHPRLDKISVHDGLQVIIEAALRRNDGNISKTAEELQIARSTIYRKIKRYGIVI